MWKDTVSLRYLNMMLICTCQAVRLTILLHDIHDTCTDNIEFPNVFYHHNPCTFDKRYWQLLGLKRIECVFGRHLVVSVILGSIIGYERRYVHIHNVHEMASCGPLLIVMNMLLLCCLTEVQIDRQVYEPWP
jgi:hypothetical protein